jgi:uncharacterized protein
VTVADAKLRSASKPDAKLFIIDNMNDVLQESEADIQKNMAKYWNPDLPLKSSLVDGMINFIFTIK